MRKQCGFLFVVLLFSAISYAASVHCDFNDDGFDDIAIGVPNEDVNGKRSAGAVQVMYGRAAGLTATNNQLWHRDSPNVLGEAAIDENFGFAVACGDFNGDQVDDLAVGAPRSTVSGLQYAGSVTILYGTRANRLRATNNQLWSQDSPGVLDTAEGADSFGSSLASGDFNNDAYADLAIGVLTESLEGETRIGGAGAVHVLYGSANGLSGAGSQFWTQNSAGILDTSEGSERFGRDLVAANFGKDTASDCYDDLAIGVSDEHVNEGFEGAVNVLYGSAQGLSATGNQFWHEDSPGILGTAEPGDQFGASLVAGNFGGAQSQCGAAIADLIVGAPLKTMNSALRAGAVFVIYGTDAGLTASGNQLWHQDSPGIADTPEIDDIFGNALATGDMDAGGYLVIPVPGENTGTIQSAGAIHILYTDPATGKLTAAGSKFFHQNTPGIKDTAEFRDLFGFSLATGDFNADGQDDVVVGAPFESLDGVEAAGCIHILYNADTSFTQWFHQNSIDMKDAAQSQDQFGLALSR